MFNTPFANLLAKGIFHGAAIPGLFDNAASAPLTKLVMRLHTADPGPTGTQETNEVVYTGYEGVEIDRLLAKWNVTNNIVTPSARIEFPEMTGGVEQLATWISIGYAKTGPSMIIVRGRLAPDVQCRLGVIPAIKADTTITLVTATPA